MLAKKISYRLFHAYIRPYFQSIFNIYSVLSRTKQQHLEALNRKIFRIINRWHDATNNEITNLSTLKSVELLTQMLTFDYRAIVTTRGDKVLYYAIHFSLSLFNQNCISYL
jgi:hypothetical protein